MRIILRLISSIKKNSPKKNRIAKINVINLDNDNKNIKERNRFFSTKVVNSYQKEVLSPSKKKEKSPNKINNSGKKKHRLKLIYKSPKNINKDDNTNTSDNTHISKSGKNRHKLINRIKSINISTKSLNFGYNLRKKSSEISLNLNSFSPNNKKLFQKQNSNLTNSLNRKYSENNLSQIWHKFFEKGEHKIEKESNEFNEDQEIYYYEPQSNANHSPDNFINKKYKKGLSSSVNKELNEKTESRFNKILNSTINTLNKSLFKFIDFNFMDKEEEKKSELKKLEEKKKKEYKEINIDKIKENIQIKNKDIDIIKKKIEKIQKEIIKYDKEIKNYDIWIQKEDVEHERLTYFLNYYFNINNNNDI